VWVWLPQSVWTEANRLPFAVFLVASACFVYFLYHSAIRIPATFYNFSALVPAIALITVHLATKTLYRQPKARAVFTLPVVLFALACGIAQLGLAAQKVHAAPEHDRMMSHLAGAVDRYLSEGRRIAMDPPLAVAVDDPDKLRNIKLLFYGAGGGKWPDEPTADVLLRAQTELGSLPADVPGFRLVEDNFLHNPITRFVKPMGLYFAIYEADPGAR
jgi:hypothetical protein